jgi:hypothetical protein
VHTTTLSFTGALFPAAMVKRDWDISRARAATPLPTLPLKGEGFSPSPLRGRVATRSVVRRGDAPHPTMPSIFARKLRADATDAEIRLGAKLRRKQLDGFRFRRQQPMGRYIVDFFCPEAGLIVEVDGGQHAEESPAHAAWLKSRGRLGQEPRLLHDAILEQRGPGEYRGRGGDDSGGVAWSGSPLPRPGQPLFAVGLSGFDREERSNGSCLPLKGGGGVAEARCAFGDIARCCAPQ